MRQAVLTAAFGALLAQPAAAEGRRPGRWLPSRPRATTGPRRWAALPAGPFPQHRDRPSGRPRACRCCCSRGRRRPSTMAGRWACAAPCWPITTGWQAYLYGDRSFEKSFVYVQTPYGRFEAGEDDGAAFRLGANAPSIDPATAIDGATTTFFHDPRTGRADRHVPAAIGRLRDRQRRQIHLCFAALAWLRGGRLIAPYDAHGGLPFVSRGADRQTAIVEAGANYRIRLGSLSYTLSMPAGGGPGA